MDAQQLYRLIVLDHQLSSRGVELDSTSEQLGVTPETILDDLELLNSVGCEIVCREVDSQRRGFYVGERLFNARHDTVQLSAMITERRLREEASPLATNEVEPGADAMDASEPPCAMPDSHEIEQ
jgi:hypothetical protein